MFAASRLKENFASFKQSIFAPFTHKGERNRWTPSVTVCALSWIGEGE